MGDYFNLREVGCVLLVFGSLIGGAVVAAAFLLGRCTT